MYNPLSSTEVVEWWVFDSLEVKEPDFHYIYPRLFYYGSEADIMMNLGEVMKRAAFGEDEVIK